MSRTPVAIVAENLARIRQEIVDAAHQAGRRAEQVRLVAVTKYVSIELARALVAAGCTDLGESRPQELWQKADSLTDLPVQWHFIGHLQRNKLARTLPSVHLLHSIDSLRLLEAVGQWAATQDRSFAGLLEVNISGDASKHGFAPSEVAAALRDLPRFPALQIRGLMGMASLEGGSEQARRDFARLRALRDQLQRELPEAPPLVELSMGMSGDFREAIAEGATLVRIGSALFEGIEGIDA